jgi:hypothetical protein
MFHISLPRHIPFDPPARAHPTLSLSNGQLFVIGGQEKISATSSAGKNVSSRLVWQVPIPRSLDWPRERLMWLACYMNSRTECHLAKCPPHVMYKEWCTMPPFATMFQS